MGFIYRPDKSVGAKMCLHKERDTEFTDITTYQLPFRLYFCHTCLGYKIEYRETNG